MLHVPDPEHLRTHSSDFIAPLETVLGWVEAALVPGQPCVQITRAEPVGVSRCVPVAGRPSFWGYRLGRRVPSHLLVGRPEPTCDIVAWVEWKGERAELTTLYPGVLAPREVFDPHLPEAERLQSEQFWRAHAMIVDHRPTVYLANALSLNMIHVSDVSDVSLTVRALPLAHAQVLSAGALSIVGHADTAGLVAQHLNREVEVNRQSVQLTRGDRLLVGQYSGPRLPEGTSQLRDGAVLAWLWVDLS